MSRRKITVAKKKVMTRPQSGKAISQDEENIIKLEDFFTIDKVQKLKEILTTTLMEGNNLKFIVKKCDAIDLSAIQLLYSLYKLAQKENKTIDIDITINEVQKTLLKNTGIYNSIFTGDDTNKLLIHTSK